VSDTKKKIEAAKRASTLHLLFKCSRLLNDWAVASLPKPVDDVKPRAAHLSLFPHIDLDFGARVSDLAEALGITRQAVGQLVDDLEVMGAVARVPDPSDGRAKRVIFTVEGKNSILQGLKHLKSLEPNLAGILGVRRLKSFQECLILLHDHLVAADR
jgi:DNA-binding MarR family transcriptional regulator